MYVFPIYSPKWNLQSHILREYLKNSANKIWRHVGIRDFNLKNETQ